MPDNTREVDFPRHEGIFWHRSEHYGIDWHRVRVEKGSFGLVVNVGDGFCSVYAVKGDEWREEIND